MGTKLRLVFSITIAFLSFYGSAQSGYWHQQDAKTDLNQNFLERFDIQNGEVFSFDEKTFRNKLASISSSKGGSVIVNFPNEKGELISFRVSEQPVFSKELSQKYPNIKSYAGQAINRSKDKIRFSLSHKGIQSMIVHANSRGSTFMQKDASENYVVYSRDPNTKKNIDFICSTRANLENNFTSRFSPPIDDQVLRKFRLAVSATGEYTTYHGGTVADALAAINATITRINEVFESDLAIRLELIATTDQVIFTNSTTDPYNGGDLSPQVQTELTNTIGAANYDIGIVLNKAASDGNAGFIGSVCIDNKKGSAYASNQVPEGDFYDLDYVAHEIGHQFGANHTFSHEPEGTGVQVEPGSGTTIMGYAGITGINNVTLNGDDYFHYISIIQISDYVLGTSCAELISLENNPPEIAPAGNFVIPISTAFVLKGEATDADVDDALTYTWEQIDNGKVTTMDFGPTNPDGANFRSLKPTENPIRYFPKLPNIIAGNLTQTFPTVNSDWETVSDIQREMNFALTVRDNVTGGGQLATDLVNIIVENNAGPFIVTSQAVNAVTLAGATEEIIWDVANTEKAPINAQTVDIFLSTDGGVTFPILLVEDVQNDGSQLVQIPAIATTEARIMVKANDNVFFAVNASNFTIQETEFVLNFESLEHEVCASDVLIVPFVYETYLGFNEEVTFSIPDPPVGVDISFLPETATADGTAVVITLADTENLIVGGYPIELVATSATLSKELTIEMNVYEVNFSPITLISPLDNEIDISTGTVLEWQAENLATSYDIQIAEDLAFNTIIESGSVLNNTFNPSSLLHEKTYYWRVKPKNSCGEGDFGTPFSFITISTNCQSKEAKSLPVEISSVGTPTVVSKIPIFDDLYVTDVKVALELDHDYLADVLVTLTSPAGTTVVLFSSSCDGMRNVNATFDSNADNFICSGRPAISGTVKPLGDLTSFKGESTFGEWVLTISDNLNDDGGFLKKFSLEICAEGKFRPDDDNDGVFDDGPDLCLDTSNGNHVDTTGCSILLVEPSNYKIEAISESCRSSNNGSIIVNVETDFNYSATITGNGVNSSSDFTSPSLTVDNLTAGTYSVCITASDGTLISSEQCFDVVIGEPEILSVSAKASLDGSSIDLVLNGAPIYNIELNGVAVQVEDSNFSLNLKSGLNTLKVSTNLPCQGVYEEQFVFSKEPLVYPNPFDDFVKIFVGSDLNEFRVHLFNANGKLVMNGLYSLTSDELELDLSSLATGLYFIQFESDTMKGTSKIIKR